ncbi:MAG: hypothetical protein HYX56_07220, partial [Chloroflexi bacterium]|nr:hypothetical protein [Chloroflexota bacterium]
MKRISVVLSFALVASLVVGARPAAAGPTDPSYIYGTAFDAQTFAPLAGVCVVLGPALVRCIAYTDANGRYQIDFPPGDIISSEQELHFLYRDRGYADYDSPRFVVRGATFQPAPMTLAGTTPDTACVTPGEPTQSLYLPNVTKTLGGPTGWQTPFIVQNTGAAATTLEVSFYRFADGSLVFCRRIQNLRPGSSFADVPNNDIYLGQSSQYSVVIRSFGATVVSVVNEHQGSGDRAEAMAYDGYAVGASSVFLPNITRRFFGYVTPFIIQNLGQSTVTAQARFVSFDGTAPEWTVQRTLQSGRSQFVDPNSEPGLMDGKQYSVTVTAGGPIAVVVNTHNDAATVAKPVAYSTDGL